MENIVQARGLSRSFGDIRAVDSLEFSVPPGAVLGLIGPNGAGKTTLLRSLLGLNQFQGELAVLGKDPRSQRAQLMEQVCFIADTAVLPGWMRVEQLLDYVTGVHPGFAREQAEAFLRDTEVKPSRRIRDLSKGMVVQVHLALVMAIDARLLILDEPTTGLDPNQLIEIRKLIREIAKEKTILLSTHIMKEVEAVCDRVIIINKGELVADKKLEELREAEEQIIEVEFDYRVEEQLLQQMPNVSTVKNTGGFVYEILFTELTSKA